MADLLITIRHNTVTIVPNSEVGKRWLASNIINTRYGNMVSINRASVEDFIRDLDKADITYDQI